MSAVVQDQPAIVQRHAPQSLVHGDEVRVVAFDGRGPIHLQAFCGHVRALAAQLPDAACAINLCEDRYRFLVAFCAVALRRQTTLLPPSRTRVAIDEVRVQHPDSYCLGDGVHCGCAQDDLAPLPHYIALPDPLPQLAGSPPRIDDDALVAIGYTSGSTGAPKANPKTWRSFRTSTAQNLAALAGLWDERTTLQLVATVPPQHMYGMELSVLLPLLGNVAVHGARPFFPHDVAQALLQADAPRLLVTTPVHLRALVESGVVLPPMAGIVTATAPLSQALAAAAEARFGCEVRELFGSTETCVIARRRTAQEDAWTPLPGVRVTPQPDGTLVHAEHLPQPVALADLVELLDDSRHGDGCFLLRGRQADLLEIAGKRASLADLTRRLLAVPGVEDGVVLQLDDASGDGNDGHRVRRIAALAVAPRLSETQIMQALRASFDPVFLPRRLRRVDALPRNDTGKLTRAALLQLLQGNMR